MANCFKSNSLIAIIGIFSWLSYMGFLIPLPSDEMARGIRILQKTLTEHYPCPSCSNEQLKFDENMRLKNDELVRQYISNSREAENILWFRWYGFLTLVISGIAGWVLFAIQKPISKRIIIFTTALLILNKILFSHSVYSSLIVPSNFSFLISHLPWYLIASNIYYYYLMPILLVVITIRVMTIHNQSFKRDA